MRRHVPTWANLGVCLAMVRPDGTGFQIAGATTPMTSAQSPSPRWVPQRFWMSAPRIMRS